MKRNRFGITKDYGRLFFRYTPGALLIFGLVGFSGCANHNPPPPPNAGTKVVEKNSGFDLADKNHDGKLSRNEASDFLVNRVFNSLDVNQDDRLTKEEMTKADPDFAADFVKRDTNHDGVLTRAEALKYGRAHGIANKVMKEADTNHDGKLERTEVQAYYADREGPPR